jgi:flagellar motor switch protein FliG
MPQKFTGTQKAAILLMQAGKDRAASVLRSMREQEVAEIMAEVARLHHLEVGEINEVLAEFHDIYEARTQIAQGGYSTARELLEASFGGQKADEILDNLGVTMVAAPFEFLRRADTRQVLTYLQDEHPQTIALVLAHLAPQQSALVLSGLSQEIQADVAFRIASLERASPDVIRIIERELNRRMSAVLSAQEMATVGGVAPLVAIINRADRSTERMILEGLETVNAELAETVRAQMFIFEDILTLDDKAIQLVLRNIDGASLAMALKGVSPMVKEKISRNLSNRAAENLSEEIEMLGPVRLSQVEEAQAKIVSEIRALEQSGQIMIQRGSDEALID